MSARCSKTVIPSYYAVFVDLGRLGLEAIVQPELTRTNVIDRIKRSDYTNIVRIDHIEDGLVEDVTAELIDAAEGELKVEAINKSERMAWVADYKRDLRKNEVA